VNPWALADAIPEQVNDAVAGLFRLAARPLNQSELDQFAAEFGASSADLLPLMHEYRSEGALVLGDGEPESYQG
jgi:hypothetical protein